ncbi:MAG: hypothetical protein JW726_17205 [Anaerolineales bacterium]|nr:hypothetical protein [Anaerolineales bacterium]
MAEDELICPKCGRTDQVQKVTSLFAANTKEWTETQSYSDADGMIHHRTIPREARTRLGNLLQPPKKPAGPSHPGVKYGIILFIVLVGGSTILPFFFFPLFFVIPFLGEPGVGQAIGDLPTRYGLPNWAPIALVVVCIAGIALLILALLLYGGVLLKRRFEREMVDYRTRQVQWQKEDLPHWQRSMERWEALYYCMRDETLFIPGEGKAIPLDRMMEYIDDPWHRPYAR